jgi:uncharacterized protein (DUF3084 family)
MNAPNNPRFTIRMDPKLHQWFKAYAQRMNTSMSTLVTEYIESLQQPQASPSDEVYEPEHTGGYEPWIERADSEIAHLIEQVEEKAAEIQHSRDQLAQKDRQLAHRDDQLESALRSLSNRRL